MKELQDTGITEGIRILQWLEEPKKYIPPNTILRFFEHLMPDESNRNRFMQFIAYKHKHSMDKYSPIYFVFTGQGGTGKSILVDTILKYISGKFRHYAISTNQDVDSITRVMHEDRHLILFRCPTKLTEITDNTKDFVAQIELELPSFCKYLRDLPQIANADYYDSSNWTNTLKEKQ